MASEQTVPCQTGGPGMSDNIFHILRIGKALLIGFIRQLWQQYRASNPQVPPLEETTREDLSVEGAEASPDAAAVTSLQDCMFRIWQELSSNRDLTSMVESATGKNPLEVLADVSEHLFADGINWGRIVVFFYFAFRVIAQYTPSWFHDVVSWAMTFLQNHLANWIQQQGGWEGLLSYFGTPTWQTIAVFAAGVLTASLTFWKMS
nr:PREDICTED: apoptosis regulator BAX [Anolis carolinensis]|eukprot:XP_003225279.2 PREDICTED: apoptosis regulator BAX [Anolis carolinensis]